MESDYPGTSIARGIQYFAAGYVDVAKSTATVHVLSLHGDGDSLVVRIKHLGESQVRGTIAVDTDHGLGGEKRLGSVEPVSFTIDLGRVADVRVKLNSRLVEEELYKVTITSDDLMFRKIMHHGYIENP